MRVALLPLLFVAAVAMASEKVIPKKPTGRELFLARCATCHDPGRVSHRVASRDEWREIVYRMQRMPQSGIARAEAEAIIDHLATFGRRSSRRGKSVGGRRAYGKQWLSILETAQVVDGAVTIGGAEYRATVEGLTVFLSRRKRTRTLALTERGKPAATSLVESWRVGEIQYGVHLVLYRVRGNRVWVARALRREQLAIGKK